MGKFRPILEVFQHSHHPVEFICQVDLELLQRDTPSCHLIQKFRMDSEEGKELPYNQLRDRLGFPMELKRSSSERLIAYRYSARPH